MSINTDFYVPKAKVSHDGKEACEVRGLTPEDIAQIVNEHADDVGKVMSALEKDSGAALGEGGVADALEALSPAAFNNMLMSVPALAAKIIAIAADEPSMWGHVQKNFVMPLQFNILVEIARLTFIDKNGFKEFLGNAMALVASTGTTMRHQEPAPNQSVTAG
jgi:hypothetical protein